MLKLVTDTEEQDVATQYRNVALQVAELTATLKILRADVLAQATAMRADQTDKQAMTCIPTADGKRVAIVWRETYKDIKPDEKARLQAAFGAQYPRFVDETESVSLVAGTRLAAIKRAVQDADMDAMLDLLKVTHGLRPRKGSVQEVALLETEGELDLAADLQSFIDECLTSPQVKHK